MHSIVTLIIYLLLTLTASSFKYNYGPLPYTTKPSGQIPKQWSFQFADPLIDYNITRLNQFGDDHGMKYIGNIGVMHDVHLYEVKEMFDGSFEVFRNMDISRGKRRYSEWYDDQFSGLLHGLFNNRRMLWFLVNVRSW